jgi:Chlorophyll A-B binding protein
LLKADLSTQSRLCVCLQSTSCCNGSVQQAPKLSCNSNLISTISYLTAQVTMKLAGLFLTFAAGASAFAPASVRQGGAVSSLQASLDDMAGSTMPFKSFDPLELATLGSDETLAWFRAAELKHSRVAMLATTGYIVQAAGLHFPGMLSKEVSFESLSSMKPFDAWDAVPEAGTFDRSLLCRVDNNKKDIAIHKCFEDVVQPKTWS